MISILKYFQFFFMLGREGAWREREGGREGGRKGREGGDVGMERGG